MCSLFMKYQSVPETMKPEKKKRIKRKKKKKEKKKGKKEKNVKISIPHLIITFVTVVT